MALRIAALGDNCIDRFLPPLNYALAGGNAVNVAVQVAKLGHESAYFGAIGNDTDGNQIRSALAANGVALLGLRTSQGERTAYTDIASEAGGERRFVHEDFGACARYQPSLDELKVLATFDHVHIGWLRDGGEAKRWLRARGVSVSQDLSVNNAPEHLRPDGLSIAFASAERSEAVCKIEQLLRDGAAMAVVTLGAEGSMASDGGPPVHVPAMPVEPVDTTGAGDSFIAAFLVSHLGGASLEASLRAGAGLARSCCLHLGGFPQAPRHLI